MSKFENKGLLALNEIKDEVKEDQWVKTPTDEQIETVKQALEARNIEVIVVESKEAALEKVKSLIPADASVMTGSSTTLYEIGFMDYYIRGDNPWDCLGPKVFKEDNPEKKARLRRKVQTADYFLASSNAIAETGQLIQADASGSRVGAYPFAAKNLLIVAGYQKIVKNLEEGMDRIREFVYPIENKRAQEAYGNPSTIGKWVIMERELQKGRTTLIIVKERLGY